MVGTAGANGKNVQVGRERARPGVINRELGRHRLVEGGCWRREHYGQVMVVAQAWWANILYPDVDHRAPSDRSESPRHRPRTATDRTAGRRTGLSGDRWRVMQQQHQGCDAKQTDQRKPSYGS